MKRSIATLIIFLLALVSAWAQLPELVPLKSLDAHLTPAREGGKWGYKNAKGKFVIPAVFDAAEPLIRVGYKDGTVMDIGKIRVGQKWGYISNENVYFILPEYDKLGNFDSFSTAFGVKGHSGVLIGVEPEYSENLGCQVLKSVVLADEMGTVAPFSFKGIAIASKRSGEYGIIDTKGQWVLPCEYSKISEDKALGLFRLEKDGRIGFAAKADAKVIFDAEYLSIDPFATGIVKINNGKLGLATTDGKIILPAEYDGIDKTATALLLRKGGKEGLATPDGKIIIPAECISIDALPGGNYLVTADDGVRVLRSNGDEVFSRTYDSVQWDAAGQFYVVSVDGLYGRLDSEGKYIYPCIFPSVPDPEHKGYVEMIVDDEPYLFLAGDLAPTSARDYDNTLFRQMSERRYEETTLLPDWLKGHLGNNKRGPRLVTAPEEGAPEAPVLICYTFHPWAGTVEVSFCLSGERMYIPAVSGEEIPLVEKAEMPESEASGEFFTYNILIGEPAANGIALYQIIGVKHYWKRNRGVARETKVDAPAPVAFGYIGLGTRFFTQPLFSGAKDFDGDTAEVFLNEEWKALTPAEIQAMDPYKLPDL